MINEEARNNEELKDVLTAISVVAKRLRDKYSTETVENLSQENHTPCADDELTISTAEGLINAYLQMNDLENATVQNLYRGSGSNKNRVDGLQKAIKWYKKQKGEIITCLVSLKEGDSIRSLALDIIDQCNTKRKEVVDSFKSEIFKQTKGNVTFTKEGVDNAPDYESVKNGTLLGLDGTLQLTMYEDDNVKFSYEYDAAEGALQSDHNKRVQIYNILSSMSPIAYKWGEKSKADILRTLADNIEMAETLS